jgi:hypothetical protein
MNEKKNDYVNDLKEKTDEGSKNNLINKKNEDTDTQNIKKEVDSNSIKKEEIKIENPPQEKIENFNIEMKTTVSDPQIINIKIEN